LNVQLADTVKASVLQPDGSYAKVSRRGRKAVNAQEQFAKEAKEAAKAALAETVATKRTFTPAEHQRD